MDLLWLQVVLTRKRRHLLGVERDQRHEVGAAVAEDDGLRDPSIVPQRVLEVRGRDVLAPGRDDDVLLAAGDEQEAVLIEAPEVAGVQPTGLPVVMEQERTLSRFGRTQRGSGSNRRGLPSGRRQPCLRRPAELCLW